MMYYDNNNYYDNSYVSNYLHITVIIITQGGYSPLDWVRLYRRHEVVKILETEEKKLRK